MPRGPLLTIYKSFIRIHLDYGDVIYDQHYNNTFHQKLESIQYNAALTIKGAISFRKTLWRFRFGILTTTDVVRKLCYFFNITKNQCPEYMFDKIPTSRAAYRTRNNIDNILWYNVKRTFFKNSFFPSTAIEWNSLDKSIRSSESFVLFKKSILQFIQQSPNRTFNWHNYIGIKSITRLSLCLSHLQDHKSKHNFLDCLNPIRCCGNDIETTVHYLLHCSIVSEEKLISLDNIQGIDENILNGSNSRISQMLLFGILSFNDTKK